ncbi:MAG: HlyD family secretion protein [Bryobacteraceae bacterium]
MKRSVWTTGIFFVAVSALVLFRGRVVDREPAPAVAQAASTPSAPRAVVAPGRVEPVSEEVSIGTELDGKLAAVLVEEGQAVRRGQLIATLANGDFAARVRLAESIVAERNAELDRLRNGARTQERRESDAFVAESGAVLDQARAERERRRSLLERGAISRTEYESAEREFGVAQARVEATRQRASLVSAPSREEDIRRAEAEVVSAEARVAEAKALLGKTAIVSPINGVVLRKRMRTGESVSTQMNGPILVLGDISRLRVRVDVDETDVARVAVGQKVTVRAAAFGERTFPGTVVRVGRILGRKNIRTDEPSERVDTKVLETLVDLDPGVELPVGLRVDAVIGS